MSRTNPIIAAFTIALAAGACGSAPQPEAPRGAYLLSLDRPGRATVRLNAGRTAVWESGEEFQLRNSGQRPCHYATDSTAPWLQVAGAASGFLGPRQHATLRLVIRADDAPNAGVHVAHVKIHNAITSRPELEIEVTLTVEGAGGAPLAHGGAGPDPRPTPNRHR
jgi:hypothetical protein